MDLILILAIVVPALIGFLLCFNGYKILRLSLTLVGAVVGFFLAGFILSKIPAQMNDTVQWAVRGVFAIGLGAAAFGLYEKAVFFVGAAGGAFFTWSLYPSDSTGINKWIIIILAALVSGLAVKFINEWALKLFTGLFGARLLAFALAGLVSKIDFLSTGVSSLTVILFKTSEIPPTVAVSGLALVTFGIWGFVHQLKK